MTSLSRRFRVLLALALTSACDPGYEIDVSITVPSEVMAQYSESHRGLLLVRFHTDGSYSASEVGIVCGGDAVTWSAIHADLGTFEDSTIAAWIEPDAGDRPCGEFAPEVRQELWNDAAPAQDQPQGYAKAHGSGGSGNETAAVELMVELPGT